MPGRGRKGRVVPRLRASARSRTSSRRRCARARTRRGSSPGEYRGFAYTSAGSSARRRGGSMRLARIALLSLFPVAALAAPAPRDLVVIKQSAQELLVARNVPVTFKGASFFLAEWTGKQQV